MPLGLYIAVPFCRTKCSYCNFASDVFSRAVFDNYIKRLCAEIEHSTRNAEQMRASLDRYVDSIYFGGGTPTLLNVAQLEHVFVTIRQNFQVEKEAEITVECAPGTLSGEMLEALVRCGVNRVSLGVQSFIDKEAASVGRLHKGQTVLDDIARLRADGITNINVDLIAGLPHQTRESWENSLEQLISTGVPHASVYMLEVDEDSRLGRELMAGGQKYHAHFVPDEDLTADLYEIARDRLNAAGISQYEISNFARAGFESKHNLKYWTRQPYLGFGLDAHSMLPLRDGEAVRFSNSESLEKYLACEPASTVHVDQQMALEERLFLGLRLNRGVDIQYLQQEFPELFAAQKPVISELMDSGMLEQHDGVRIRLSSRGRLLSNEVFQRFLATAPA
ncbi:MAG TPA: radical SAM family heme chaperone HemW [Terriglobales bacterium]|nr:radical SAM family heme chaperone HemW [Terriglobales bacterium]